MGNPTDDFLKVPIDEGTDSGEKEEDKRNGMYGTALAIISTIMGGGIVSIPFAYAVAGVATGISVQVCVIIAIWFSCVLYLETRRILRCNTSFSEIAKLCLGSVSGIILNMLLVFAVFGILALYMILFSEIAISLVGDSFGEDSFMAKKTFYVSVLSVLIAPIISRKKINELKISTYVLFFGVLSLIVLLTVLLAVNGSYDYRLENDLLTEAQVKAAAKLQESRGEASGFESVVDSLNIAVAS